MKFEIFSDEYYLAMNDMLHFAVMPKLPNISGIMFNIIELTGV